MLGALHLVPEHEVALRKLEVFRETEGLNEVPAQQIQARERPATARHPLVGSDDRVAPVLGEEVQRRGVRRGERRGDADLPDGVRDRGGGTQHHLLLTSTQFFRADLHFFLGRENLLGLRVYIFSTPDQMNIALHNLAG